MVEFCDERRRIGNTGRIRFETAVDDNEKARQLYDHQKNLGRREIENYLSLFAI